MARKREVYWLSDADWEAIQPHLPSGRRGVRRADDHRVFRHHAHASLIVSNVPFSWVAADSIYGVGDIEMALKRAAKGYVLSVNANHPFRSWAKPQAVAETARDIAESLPETGWRRLSAGDGIKGARLTGPISNWPILMPVILMRHSPASGHADC